MESFTYTITDDVGLHARPAGLLVKAVKDLDSQVVLQAKGKRADARRIMAVMALGVKKGESVTVNISGEHAAEDARILKEFFERNL